MTYKKSKNKKPLLLPPPSTSPPADLSIPILSNRTYSSASGSQEQRSTFNIIQNSVGSSLSAVKIEPLSLDDAFKLPEPVDDYSLHYIYSMGLRYCESVKVNKGRIVGSPQTGPSMQQLRPIHAQFKSRTDKGIPRQHHKGIARQRHKAKLQDYASLRPGGIVREHGKASLQHFLPLPPDGIFPDRRKATLQEPQKAALQDYLPTTPRGFLGERRKAALHDYLPVTHNSSTYPGLSRYKGNFQTFLRGASPPSFKGRAAQPETSKQKEEHSWACNGKYSKLLDKSSSIDFLLSHREDGVSMMPTDTHPTAPKSKSENISKSVSTNVEVLEVGKKTSDENKWKSILWNAQAQKANKGKGPQILENSSNTLSSIGELMEDNNHGGAIYRKGLMQKNARKNQISQFNENQNNDGGISCSKGLLQDARKSQMFQFNKNQYYEEGVSHSTGLMQGARKNQMFWFNEHQDYEGGASHSKGLMQDARNIQTFQFDKDQNTDGGIGYSKGLSQDAGEDHTFLFNEDHNTDGGVSYDKGYMQDAGEKQSFQFNEDQNTDGGFSYGKEVMQDARENQTFQFNENQNTDGGVRSGKGLMQVGRENQIFQFNENQNLIDPALHENSNPSQLFQGLEKSAFPPYNPHDYGSGSEMEKLNEGYFKDETPIPIDSDDNSENWKNYISPPTYEDDCHSTPPQEAHGNSSNSSNQAFLSNTNMGNLDSVITETTKAAINWDNSTDGSSIKEHTLNENSVQPTWSGSEGQDLFMLGQQELNYDTDWTVDMLLQED